MITILILQLDGTILQDKHTVKLIAETNYEEEVVVRCSEEAERITRSISTHTWDKPQHGWYMNDDTGLVIGYMY